MYYYLIRIVLKEVNMKDYKISEFIKELRKERKYTVAGLAEECGIGIRGFNKWLKK